MAKILRHQEWKEMYNRGIAAQEKELLKIMRDRRLPRRLK
jgi:hypothetical protein